MGEIGGYFEWEMPRGGGSPHDGATVLLNSARSCLALLLRHERPARIRTPYYNCDEALEPVDPESTEIDFYSLDDDLEIDGDLPDLEADERLIYVNYFGLKSDYVRRLARRYRDKLWVDEVQAFFHAPQDDPAVHFNSARKFVGVPDGAYLYLPRAVESRFGELSLPANTEYKLEHLTLRLAGRTLDGHPIFQENDALNGRAFAEVSEIGRAILDRIDYASIASTRRANYRHLHAALGSSNRISARVLELPRDAVPYCYPYLPVRPLAREPFWDRQIFVPILWRECVGRVADGFDAEKELAAEMLPLPIDQRYDTADMDRIVAAVRELAGRTSAAQVPRPDVAAP